MTDKPIISLIERIRETRKAQGLSVRGLAELANVPPSTIQEIDKPSWNPTLKTLAAIEGVLLSSEESAA